MHPSDNQSPHDPTLLAILTLKNPESGAALAKSFNEQAHPRSAFDLAWTPQGIKDLERALESVFVEDPQGARTEIISRDIFRKTVETQKKFLNAASEPEEEEKENHKNKLARQNSAEKFIHKTALEKLLGEALTSRDVDAHEEREEEGFQIIPPATPQIIPPATPAKVMQKREVAHIAKIIYTVGQGIASELAEFSLTRLRLRVQDERKKVLYGIPNLSDDSKIDWVIKKPGNTMVAEYRGCVYSFTAFDETFNKFVIFETKAGEKVYYTADEIDMDTHGPIGMSEAEMRNQFRVLMELQEDLQVDIDPATGKAELIPVHGTPKVLIKDKDIFYAECSFKGLRTDTPFETIDELCAFRVMAPVIKTKFTQDHPRVAIEHVGIQPEEFTAFHRRSYETNQEAQQRDERIVLGELGLTPELMAVYETLQQRPRAATWASQLPVVRKLLPQRNPLAEARRLHPLPNVPATLLVKGQLPQMLPEAPAAQVTPLAGTLPHPVEPAAPAGSQPAPKSPGPS